MEEGHAVPGPCEVRYAWKYNDLKPRIYYAIGADAYFHARYMWRIFDSLVKVFRSTHPESRYNTYRFPMFTLPESVFLIYDYTSFTSMLEEFKRYCAWLGDFLKGYTCRIWDTHCGVREDDLGSLMHAYNAACNIQAEFSVHRLTEQSPDDTSVILNHHVAGLLGVFGNIVGSTSLHGLVGIQITGNQDWLNAIGDDAEMLIDGDLIGLEETKDCIRLLGDIADEKFEIFIEDEMTMDQSNGWHFTKRPITVSHHNIETGWMPDFPIMARILGQQDGQHTISPEPHWIRRRLLIKQTCRLFDSMRLHLRFLDDDDIPICLQILRTLYRTMLLPENGSFPMKRRHDGSEYDRYPDTNLCVPVLCEESITKGWWTTLREQRGVFQEIITIPVAFSGNLEFPMTLTIGDTFHYTSEKGLALFEKLGKLGKTMQMEDRMVSDQALDTLESFIFRRSKPVYEYCVFETVDLWPSYACINLMPSV
jgi:hypothetical protein